MNLRFANSRISRRGFFDEIRAGEMLWSAAVAPSAAFANAKPPPANLCHWTGPVSTFSKLYCFVTRKIVAQLEWRKLLFCKNKMSGGKGFS